MNIKEAKIQIKNAMTAYFTKDEYGNYLIPTEKQRPVFLMGPPGIGKTAIVEQIAHEMNVPVVSYSMTHHTRQSALGLPFISHKVYDGKEYDISEYTMSEIIASVYDMMEKTGKREGILFLDEINCVSETLSPIMLQFLQYKVFGKHRVPEGWIVVTAGNPPEYNNSVREFDIVTWDRLKRIDIEPDYECWREYAIEMGVHPAILSYTDLKRDCFYLVESVIGGKTFVTARGWEDLSKMIRLYEKNNLTVDENLIGQYLQNRDIAKNFAIYYDLFQKYKSDYQISSILEGKASGEIVGRAKNAKFDERLSVLHLLLDAVTDIVGTVAREEAFISRYFTLWKNFKASSARQGVDGVSRLRVIISEQQKELDVGQIATTLNEMDRYCIQKTINSLELMIQESKGQALDAGIMLQRAMADIQRFGKENKKMAEDAGKQLENAIEFCESAFGENQEMLVFITELTLNKNTATFISNHGCEAYFRHNKELLLYERQVEIIRGIDQLALDDNQ